MYFEFGLQSSLKTLYNGILFSSSVNQTVYRGRDHNQPSKYGVNRFIGSHDCLTPHCSVGALLLQFLLGKCAICTRLGS